MVNSLAKFVAFKTISSSPKFSGECNQGAAFLRRHCSYLGAKTRLLTSGQDTNPTVCAKFNASSTDKVDKTLLFYGHYDVVGADTNRPKWRTDPFQLTPTNGFLYGRGVSDNKGPILAALYAAADLAQTKALRCNVVFLIEGEEESGSQGFHETVRQYKSQIGPVDWILLANSYWLDDFQPCLTYGLRGVVHANLVITSDHPDLHSGIDGSSLLDEPLKDLSMLLASLVGPKGRINLPGFHDPVLSLTEAEKQRYAAIAETLLRRHPEIVDSEGFIDSLMHRWREPSLTIHSVEVPGCKNATTTISRKAKASLSIRIVPNQDADEVAANLINYAQEQFDLLESQNELTVEITGKSEPWLGDPENEIFETLSRAISSAWTPNQDQTSKKWLYPRMILDPTPTSSSSSSSPPPPSVFTLTTTGTSTGPPPPPPGPRGEPIRKDSTDSLASHIDRVISSTTSSSAGKRATRKRSTLSAPVPTSSTLIRKSSLLPPGSGRGPDRPSSSPSLSHTTSHPPPSASASTSTSVTGTADSETPDTGTDTSFSPSLDPPHVRVKPIYIREGGSIPTIRLLEKEFEAPAANLPCGQASDNAHLDNERLRVENLYKSREIFRFVFERLPGGC